MKKQLKDHFIPHEGNDYKPNSLQKFSVGVMFVLILLSFSLANIQALLWISSDWLVSTILPSVIVELTNDERTDEALGGLTRSAVLDEAARLKAEDMAKYSYFAHHSPQGVSPWHWFDVAGYRYIHAGENLAVHFTDSADVVDAWMESPSHKANIMNGNYTEIGIGTAKGEYLGYPTVFVVQLFGTPAAVPVQVNAVTQTEPDQVVAALVKEETPIVAAAEVKATEQVEQPETPDPVEETEPEDVISEENKALSVEEVEQTDSVEVALETTQGEEFHSSFASNTRAETPVAANLDGGSNVEENALYRSVSWMGRLATQPSVWLQVFYALMALLVFVSLFLSIAIEWRKQHPVQIAYGTGLVAVMALLTYVHTTLTHSVIIF